MLSDAIVNIAAGQLATGVTASNGTRYGSDNFFTGGAGRKVVQRTRRSGGDATQIKGVAPHAEESYETFREGRFRNHIPLANGTYRLVLGLHRAIEGDGGGGCLRRCQRHQGGLGSDVMPRRVPIAPW